MFKNFLLYFFFSLIFANISYSNDKVVFIEINYIFKNSNVGKELNLKILDEDKKLNQEINNYRKKIDDEKNKILSQKNVLSVEEYNKKIVVLEDYIKNINLEIKKKNDDFIKFRKKIENSFSKELNLIIEEYSLKHSIGIILNKEDLLMAKKNLDITLDVLKLFNEKITDIKID
tara:strand:- start:479 stop:1000 length:522 start_codon:yes stop_codon:yes gene_type:complete